MKEKIEELIKLAKEQYGEYEQEFIGYKVADYWTEDWEWEDIPLISQEKMQSLTRDDKELNDLVGIHLAELLYLLNSNKDYYHFEDNIVVKRCYKVLNEGWKNTLLKEIAAKK